jgi:hypothetical protein
MIFHNRRDCGRPKAQILVKNKQDLGFTSRSLTFFYW